ncbi:MAG: DUF1667 domain-containing protein [Lachnospiraceae bacterium]|nr:DUF1667 domain-containing protein [Lachnospiraceae bacterium]
MEKRELTCICCPMGCQLSVTINGEDISVTGNTCPRGAEYAKKEVTNPRRTVTSSVKVTGSKAVRVPVKTKTDIPKGDIFKCMDVIRGITVKAPVKIGDIVCENIAGTGVDLVATKDIY